jgi:hypothetical protein
LKSQSPILFRRWLSDNIWYLIAGVFIGGISTMILMSMMYAASKADDLLLGDKQYDEN